MSSLQEHVDDYLRLRRGLGFKLERHGQILPQLAAYLEAAGASTITRELAIAWARLPAGAHPRHWAARLAAARGFAAYLQTIDPSIEVPPADVFAVRYQRPAPVPAFGEHPDTDDAPHVPAGGCSGRSGFSATSSNPS